MWSFCIGRSCSSIGSILLFVRLCIVLISSICKDHAKDAGLWGQTGSCFYESLQYRHTQKPIALLCDSKRDQVSPMNTKIRIRFIQERACHHPICDFFRSGPNNLPAHYSRGSKLQGHHIVLARFNKADPVINISETYFSCFHVIVFFLRG